MDIICDVRYLGIIEVSSQKSEQHEFFALPDSYCGCLVKVKNTKIKAKSVFFKFQNLLEMIFIIFIRSTHRALIKSICELKHKFSSNVIPKRIGFFTDEIEYVCASQSSITSFKETPTSIHKGRKRKENKKTSIIHSHILSNILLELKFIRTKTFLYLDKDSLYLMKSNNIFAIT
ncbi:hypothetical protein BpHYR1_005906 [Brachionus plicatilis]|uniref:Uncharacterized protein n=1 Tax=Brachionus plicatilis TaxID=10195 RepID=A0A3M7PTZ0_BRAPC|nr:hypothetical protein BpHYR1_005906 [Brachionus plicatilis]